ncbi:MAG: hypothetical protein V1873_02040 [Verrucomicrobiota bacterium]
MGLASIGVMLAAAQLVYGDVIWHEDFSDISDWHVWSGSATNAGIVGLGTMADLIVSNNDGIGTFIPTEGLQTLAPFDPSQKSAYDVTWAVDSLDNSCSYHIHLDLYDASSNYFSTTWNLTAFDTRTGSVSTNLGSFTFDANTRFVKPKMDVTTGFGDQWVRMDDLAIEAIPEPGTSAMIFRGAGALLVVLGLRRLRYGTFF